MLDKFPMVSVIILNFNGKSKIGKVLDECLSSVLNSDYPNFEIVFVDNGSMDGSVEYVKEKFNNYPNLKLLKLEKNYGYAGGNNVGFKHTDRMSKYIVFLNNDVVVEKDWLKKLVEVMESDSLIGAGQPKILNLFNKHVVDSAGGFIDYLGRSKRRGRGEIDKGQYDEVCEVFYASGAAMIVKREVLEKVGLFDPDYFLTYEEVDLCWRVWLAGWKVVYIPSAVVYHGESMTTKTIFGHIKSPQILYHSRKNQLSTLIKNYSLFNLTRYGMLALILYTGFSLVMLLLKEKIVYGLIELKAIYYTVKKTPQLFKKRLTIQKTIRRVKDKEALKLIKQFKLK